MTTTTYPFEFFLEERMTMEQILEEVKENHQEAKEFLATYYPEAALPSLLDIAEAMQGIYPFELNARAALRDDVVLLTVDIGKEVRAFPGTNLNTKIVNFTDFLLDAGQTFDLDSEFGIMFVRDIETALKLAELPYVPLAPDETDFWSPQV
jgi:hypothetical protein